MKQNREFKGVWIPKKIWLNKNLTLQEKVFLIEIDSLDNEKGCFAGNAYFADFFNLSKGRCSQIIKSLEEKGYLKKTIKRKGKEIVSRTLRVVNELNTPIKNAKQPPVNILKDNNTVINNNTNIYKSEEEKEITSNEASDKLFKYLMENDGEMQSLLERSNWKGTTKELHGIIDDFFAHENNNTPYFKKRIDTHTNKVIAKLQTWLKNAKVYNKHRKRQPHVLRSTDLHDKELSAEIHDKYNSYIEVIEKKFKNIKKQHYLKASEYEDLQTDKTYPRRYLWLNERALKNLIQTAHEDWNEKLWLKSQFKNIFEYILLEMKKIANR